MAFDLATAPNVQTLGSISQVREKLEADALAWASQKGDQLRNEAIDFIQNEQAIFEQRAAQWKADEQAAVENRALVWKANEEQLFKSKLQARLVELEQQNKTYHAERLARERARTAEARRLSSARSDRIREMKQVEDKLRAEIKTHEEAQGTEVQSLRNSLADKDSELKDQSSSNTQLRQQLETSKLELMRARVCGSQKNVEIAALREDKNALLLQGRSAIAAKDTSINDLQKRLDKAEAENEKLARIAKDKQEQIDKLKVQGSKTEDKLAVAVSQNPKHRSRMAKVQKHFAKCKFTDGAADLVDALGDFEIGTPSGGGSKRQAAGGVKLGRTNQGRVGKAQPGASIRPRRRQRRAADSDGHRTDESDG